MSEKYMFFNSTDDDEREYSAADMADMLSGVCPNGVIEGLEVTGASTISPGKAMINGYYYSNDEKYIYGGASYAVGKSDYYVLRLNKSAKAITIGKYTAILDNEFKLEQNNNVWEIALGKVTYYPIGSAVRGIITDLRTFTRDYRNLVNRPIRSGTSEPLDSLGNDGDIYIKYQE